MARFIVPNYQIHLFYNKNKFVGKQRDLPVMPPKSFKEMFKDGELND